MIDVENETLLTPNQACKEFPGGISLPTVWRYMGTKGVRGARLESLVCGGKRWTSKEAIARFIAAQNATDLPAAPKITATQRRRQSEAARLALQEMGL
jgi:hypothetical protein